MKGGLAIVLACLALAPLSTASQAALRRGHPAAADGTKRRSPEKQFPVDATWILQTMNGKPVTGEPPSFRIDSALRGSGFSGCNSFSTTLYPIRDQKLAAGAIALTRKTCDKAVMSTERSFLVGLHSLPRWDLRPDGDLTVTGASGPMVFRRGL